MQVKIERFKRLATYRTNQILTKLKILGNCANKSAYEYTEDEINRIFIEIEKMTRFTKSKFYIQKKSEFKL
ncbi:hypothetical protein CO051_03495 [Candidatus Roizmanbacteria bacterium CG_4_9_14_0_2_um_filter_39_13]|uniref:Four helix bundle protein n=1 Tax=Candidatus Roizmanbacteria bacterium CG_4_9_14_0_2_um_filter_39_13 TaxID=1974839 RepID=A0A2M8EZ43_9BACT|nr:MAG: hypothetical protein CO051_03495 [Candidatus Roizmanbacteria bacterium CG_4_9_14_0_2_um_filter_39_13]